MAQRWGGIIRKGLKGMFILNLKAADARKSQTTFWKTFWFIKIWQGSQELNRSTARIHTRETNTKKESKIKEKRQNKSVLCEVEADKILTDSGGGAPE